MSGHSIWHDWSTFDPDCDCWEDRGTMRTHKKCSYTECTRACFWTDTDNSLLISTGWIFHEDGRALCPPHAKQVKLMADFLPFAAL